MDLVSLLKIALRRWYLVLPIGLASVALAAYVQSTIPPEYQATGSVLLASPSLDPSSVSSTAVDARQIATDLSETDARQAFVDSGADADYSIAPLDDFTFEVVATGEEEDAAVRTAAAVADEFVEVVDELQEDTPEVDRFRSRVLTTDIVAEEQEDGSYRAAAIVLVEDPGATMENPYPPAAATARIIEVAIESDEGRARVAQAAGDEIRFDLSQQARDAAPIFTIDTFGSDRQRTLQAFEHVRNIIDQDLDERQARASVPARRRTTTEVLAEPLAVVDVSPPLNRAVAGIVAVGGLLALGIAFATESFARRRSHPMGPVDLARHTGSDEMSVPFTARQPGGEVTSDDRNAERPDRARTSANLPR